jgi:hypothetical protein
MVRSHWERGSLYAFALCALGILPHLGFRKSDEFGDNASGSPLDYSDLPRLPLVDQWGDRLAID